ncbi:glucose 1-dehydrogenase [Zhongshania sp. BJYM1]|jgi:NAD(P)-dependent dehydrogenase (short-subunit alcohol dehydrogenase family)|uniref:glucose 1-dehydrogenase n=1 Tax=Zhongshania aquatica TaxID=2965069 RepID=UPI0022B2D204|nr:glucose 1-dehydrogenase [Marortus sp. BJYM1]
MSLETKVALVTGAGVGIGEATCRGLAAAGALVVVSDIDQVAGNRVADDLNKGGYQAVFMRLDVCDEAQWREVVADIVARFGSLHILINNAGIANICGVEDETLAGWRKTNTINSDAVFLGTREAIRVMKESGGSIVNVSSIEGIVGDPMLPAYNASKGAVRAFTKSVALYCADKGYPIRVNSMHPGYVATPLVSGALSRLSDSDAEAFTQRVLASIPMGRMAEATEIAKGIVFLASDDASYMTGSELIMDGGYTAR